MGNKNCYVNDADCTKPVRYRQYEVEGQIYGANLCDWHHEQYASGRYNAVRLPLMVKGVNITAITSGKWWVEVSHSSTGIHIDTAERNVAVVNLKHTSTSWGDTAMFQPENAECLANAHLIAVAPRMRETLKAIVDLYGVGITAAQFAEQIKPFIEDARAEIVESIPQRGI